MGRELAIKFAALGANPVCIDINEKGNAETARLVGDLTGKKAPTYKYVLLGTLGCLLGCLPSAARPIQHNPTFTRRAFAAPVPFDFKGRQAGVVLTKL